MKKYKLLLISPMPPIPSRERPIKSPRRIRSLLHHAWLHLFLRQSIADDETSLPLLTAMNLLTQTNQTYHGLNPVVVIWHRDHCKRCQEILTVHLKEAVL